MSNEIKFGFKSGETLTVDLLKSDTTVRESGIVCTETGVTGGYFATPAAIVAGDLIIVDDGTDKVLQGIYRPDVTAVGGSTLTAQEVVDALMADTGFTAGGTLTYADMLKVLAAWAAGNWRLKSGETTVYEILDIDDGTTVIMEFDLDQTTPFKQVTLI